MDQKQSSARSKRVAKKRKLDIRCNEIEVLPQSAYIFKLPVEILAAIFDNLPINDLDAMSKTCKWMRHIAVQHYQLNYFGFSPRYEKHGDVCLGAKKERILMDEAFFQIFDNIWILHANSFREFCKEHWEFHQLKKLELRGVDLKKKFRMNVNQKMALTRLDELAVSGCKMDESAIEYLLSLSPNVKRLLFDNINTTYKWFECSFPALNRFEFIPHNELYYKLPPDCIIVPIVPFLELNPNIQSLGINSKNVLGNRHALIKSNIKLDNLAIYLDSCRSSENIEELKSLCSLLNELHRLGLYNRLKLYTDFGCIKSFDQKVVDEITKLNALIKLFIGTYTKFSEDLKLSALKNLKEICVSDSTYILDLETMATTFENLERIHFGRSNLDDLMMFIRRNSKLTQIKVNWFLEESGNFAKHKVINLSSMNKERSKLRNASKITIYVKEDIYLATKQAEQSIDLECIRLKRHDSFVGWDNDFCVEESYGYSNYKGKRMFWSETGEKTIRD